MTPQNAVEFLNAAKKGSLLGILAEAMRAATQTPGRPQARVPFHTLNLLANKLRKLNGRLARRPVAMHSFFTSKKPLRLLLSPQSQSREMRAIFAVVNASEAGILDRLKACEYCQRFFVARRDVDRFCPGDSCRKNWHRKTPEGKKHNAEYQRERRRRELARDARVTELLRERKGRK